MQAVISAFFVAFFQAAGTAAICYFTVRHQVRYPKRRIVCIILLLTVGYAAAFSILETTVFASLHDALKMLLNLLFLLSSFLYMKHVVRDGWPRLVFLLFMAVNTFAVCQSVTFLLYYLLFPSWNSGPYIYEDILFFAAPIIVLTPCFLYIIKRLYSRLEEIEQSQLKNIFTVPLIFAVLFIMAVNLFPASLIGEASSNAVQIIITACAFITYSQMSHTVVNAANAAREREKFEQVNTQLELQAARMEEMSAHADELKRIRHDERQHLAALKGILVQGSMQEALSYLQEYEAKIQERIQPPLCEHFVVNALCQQYLTLSRQANIQTDIDIVLPACVGISNSDLSVLLGNLWENAIAAASFLAEEKRYIHLKIKKEECRVMIRMDNSFQGVIYEENGHFISTKRSDNRVEGIGIRSIKAIAERYDGMAVFTHTSELFTASILLYLNAADTR